jgi:RHS repeat-associated protein
MNIRIKFSIAVSILVGTLTPSAWAGPSVEYTYDKWGHCTSVTDELGHMSTTTYDDYGRPTSYTEPLNARSWDGSAIVPSRTWTWTYERVRDGVTYASNTHTAKEWRTQTEPAFDKDGNQRMTLREYDVNNRLTSEQTGWVVSAGGVASQSPDFESHSFDYDEVGNKIFYEDPRHRVTTYTYDERNRLWKTIEPLNRITENNYDFAGNKNWVKFPDLKMQQWLSYDAFGQPRQFIDERGNVTDFDYWPWGPMKKLARVTTHRGKDGGGTEDQITAFYYDLMGRPQNTYFPDQTNEYSTYEFGQLKTWKTRRNQTKTIGYDARGREITHSWNDQITPGVSRTWDAANRLTSISNIFSSIDYYYDDAGQVIWEGNDISGSGGRTQTNYYRYLSGEVAHLHYPGGVMVRRDYTARGQLQATGWDDDDNNWWMKLAAYTYQPDGKVDHIDYGNGIRSQLGYDDRGFTNRVQHYRVSTSQNYSTRDYYRDTPDRIYAFKKSTDNSVNPMENGRGDRFAYDSEGQLTDGWYNVVDPAGNFNSGTRKDHFDYDALGNRQGGACNLASRDSGQRAVSYVRRDNGLNQYSHWWPAGTDYGIYYDDNFNADWQSPGNGVTMGDGWLAASYDALNRPVAMWSFTYQATPNFLWFGYDPLGRCVKRWISGTGADFYINPATYFNYDGWNLIQEGNNAWGPSRNYVQGNRVDEIVWSYNTSTGEQAFHHYEARAHCTLLTDSSGNILEQYEYDGFGQPYFFDASGNPIGSYDLFNQWHGYSQFGNRFLFTGREWLSDVRLYDYRNRMYQPELGRFMQPDPKEFGAGDYNLYRYCHNDPVNRSDPFGLDAETDARRAAFESGTTLLGIGIGSFFGGSTGALGFAAGPVGLATTPAGAIEGAAIGGGVGLAIGKALSPVLFKEGGNNPYGSRGKPDHQAAVDRAEAEARAEAKPGEQVLRERKIQGVDSNRRPDSQIVGRDGVTRKVIEAERNPTSQRNLNREAEYRRLKVEQVTRPVP